MSKFNLKIIFLTLIFCFLILTKSYAAVLSMNLRMDDKVVKYETEEVFIYINDKLAETKEMPAIILNERTLVPAREVFEQMECTVTWVQDTKEVIVTKGDTEVTLKINSQNVKCKKDVDVTYKEIDVPAKIINDKTMIPIRAVSELMDAKVDWIQSERIVDIRYDENFSDIIPSDIDIDLQDEIEDTNSDDQSSNEINKEWTSKNKIKVEETKINYEQNNKTIINSFSTNYKNEDYIELTLNATSKVTGVNVSTFANKLVVDISNADLTDSLKNSDGQGNSHTLASNPAALNIYFGEHKDDNYLRAVVTLKVTSAKYNVSLSSDRKNIIIKIYKTEINKITYKENNEDYSEFIIEANGEIDGEAHLLTDDYRLYIDIKNISKSFGDKTEKISKSNFVKQIRVASYDNYARFVLDLNKLYDYKTEKINDSTIKVTISKLNFKDLDYTNSNEYKITINDSKLKNISISKIVITEDYMNGIYEIDLGSDYKDEIGLDKLFTYDQMIDSFEILNRKVKNSNHTIIKFNPKYNRILAFNVNKKSSGIEIEILVPGDKYDKVLIIDPGHAKGNAGTSDEDYGGPSFDKVNIYREEDLTLIAALSMYDYLNENSDIKVYLTRESNTKMNDFITKLNDSNKLINGRWMMENNTGADAFLSIHINYMTPNKVYDNNLCEVRDKNYSKEKANVTSYNGSEIIYNYKKNTKGDGYNGLSNEKYAKEILDAFIDETDGTYFNDGEEEKDYYNHRDEQIKRTAVVREAEIPSALIELGVINNVLDHDKLIDKDYLTKCGEALGKILKNIFDKYKLNKN